MRDISLHLMDIIQNSITAEAKKIIIRISTEKSTDMMCIQIQDDGKGMDKSFLAKAKNPFVTTRTTRSVGLGIPLLEASSRRAGGDLKIESEKGEGTLIQVTFQISHIDRIPLGDVAETTMTFIAANPEIDFQLILSNGEKDFEFSLLEVKNQMSGISIEQIEILLWIKKYIENGITEIFGGVLSEIYG